MADVAPPRMGSRRRRRRITTIVAGLLVVAFAGAAIPQVSRAAATKCVPPGFAGVSEYDETLPGASCAVAFSGVSAGLVAPAGLRAHPQSPEQAARARTRRKKAAADGPAAVLGRLLATAPAAVQRAATRGVSSPARHRGASGVTSRRPRRHGELAAASGPYAAAGALGAAIAVRGRGRLSGLLGPIIGEDGAGDLVPAAVLISLVVVLLARLRRWRSR